MPNVSDDGIEPGASAAEKEPAVQQLVARAANDAAAFSALYRQYVPRVYRYILARVGNHAEAEDLTAQVFMVVLQQLKRFGGGQNFSAWVFTIARNKVVDSYRKNRKAVPLEAISYLAAQDGDPYQEVAQSETISSLKQVLHGLQSDQQEMLRLRFAAELSYAEIGLVIGKTEAAIKMAMSRLLRTLQEKMERGDE